MLINVLKKFCYMIIRFRYQTVSSFFLLLQALSFYQKLNISSAWKESFSKSSFAFFSAFISIHTVSHGSWITLKTLWTYFKTNPQTKVSFKFLIWITHLVLLYKLATSFLIFSVFILSGQNVKSLLISCSFSRYWTSISRKYTSLLSSL